MIKNTLIKSHFGFTFLTLLQIQHVMTDSKLSLDRIGEMRAVADKLNKTADKFNIKEFASVASDLSKRTNEVFQTITNQQRAMQNVFADFLQDLRGQNDHVVQALGGNKRDLEALLRLVMLEQTTFFLFF